MVDSPRENRFAILGQPSTVNRQPSTVMTKTVEQTSVDRQADRAKVVRTAALQLLARREHSSEELKRKLVDKGHAPDLVVEVVAALQGKRMVSDERFVASFVHHHANRGQGPVRIRAELRQHGVVDGLIQEHLRASDARRHVREEVPFYTGRRRTPTELVADLP